MAELSKAQLTQENGTSFPNNNSGYITPAILREYNQDVIDSTVNQTVYTADSASFSSRIEGIDDDNVTTASFNAYTQSTNQFTASISTSVGLLQTFSGSQYKADSSSFDSRINSFATASIPAGTVSSSAQITALGFVSSSITASSIVTASVSQSTITFTKGDGSQFNIVVADVSGSSGNFVTTASFNSYTASQDFKNTTFATTASVNSLSASIYSTDSTQSNLINGKLDTSSFTTFSTSVDSRLDGLELSGSGFATTASVNALSASIYQTDSTQSNAITNNSSSFATSISASNFNITNNSASVATTINNLSSSIFQTDSTQSNNINSITSKTGSYATTGSNTFVGNQTVNGDISASGNISASSLYVTNATIVNLTTIYETSSVIYSSGSNQLGDALTDTQILSGSVFIVGSGSVNGNRILTTADTASLVVSSSLYSVTASYAVFAQTASEARNLIVIARNGNQSTLSAGTVVHITSAVGDNPIFNTASFDTELLSANTLGILRSTLSSGADGEVVVNGIVTGVNTDPANGYAAGDVVYLSSSGQFTKVQPQAPNQIVVLGQVLRAQQNNGSLYVSINNGWELNELHNVQINTPLTNDLLAYESSSYGLWKNKSFSSLGLATTSSVNDLSSSVYTLSQSVDSRLDSLEGAGYVTSAITASSLVTASVSGNTMTFTKGDSSTFNVTLPTGSGGTGVTQIQDEGSILGTATSFNFIGAGVSVAVSADTASVTISGGSVNTGSFATTGSNTFIGTQIVTGSIVLSENSNLTVSNGGVTKLENTWVKALICTSSVTIIAGGLTSTGSIYTTDNVYAISNIYASGAVSASTITGLGNAALFSQSVDSRLIAATGSRVGLITTGSAGTGSQTVLGDFNFNTSYTASNPVVNQAGGTNVLGIDYGAFNDVLNYWGGLNFAGVLVNGTGVTNASISSYNFGAYLEATLSSGTTTNGDTYTLTGPALQDISITGSLQATYEMRVLEASTGNRAVMDPRGFYSRTSNTSVQAGASIDGGLYTFNGANGNNIRIAATSSQVNSNSGPTPFDTPQIAVDQNNNGAFTQISFQSNNNYTDGTITVHQPLFVSSSLRVSNGANITGSVTISGSAASDLTVVGQIFVSSSATSGASAVPKITVSGSAGTTTILRNSITTRNADNQAALNPLAIYASDLTTSDEIGFSVDAAGSGIAGWTTGPAIYVNNDAGDTYPAVFGFQDKANYTDGRVTVLTPLVAQLGSIVTGSAIISGSLKVTGSVAGNVEVLSVASSTASIDLSKGTFFTLTIPSSSVTFITATNITPGTTANIVLTQQSTTGSVRFDSMFKFPSGSINTGSAVASAVDLVSVMSVNTTTLLSAGAKNLI